MVWALFCSQCSDVGLVNTQQKLSSLLLQFVVDIQSFQLLCHIYTLIWVFFNYVHSSHHHFPKNAELNLDHFWASQLLLKQKQYLSVSEYNNAKTLYEAPLMASNTITGKVNANHNMSHYPSSHHHLCAYPLPSHIWLSDLYVMFGSLTHPLQGWHQTYKTTDGF